MKSSPLLRPIGRMFLFSWDYDSFLYKDESAWKHTKKKYSNYMDASMVATWERKIIGHGTLRSINGSYELILMNTIHQRDKKQTIHTKEIFMTISL